MPKAGDYVLMTLQTVFTAWGKQKMQLGDVYKVTRAGADKEFEWVPYTDKIIKAKGVTLTEVLEWSTADGQVAMWRDYITAQPPPAKKTKAATATKATASSSSSSSSSSTTKKGKGKGK